MSRILTTTEMDLKLFTRYDEGKILFIFGRRKSLIEGFTQIFYLECVSLVKIFIWKSLWFKTKTNGWYSGNLCRQNQKNRIFQGVNKSRVKMFGKVRRETRAARPDWTQPQFSQWLKSSIPNFTIESGPRNVNLLSICKNFLINFCV